MRCDFLTRRPFHATWCVPAGIAALLLVQNSCGGTEPTSVRPALELRTAEPVIAQFVLATGILVAEFPVTVFDTRGPGGTLAFVETTIVNRSRGTVVQTNRRPNATFSFADTTLPRGGSLTAQAGIGFGPPPPSDEIVVSVWVGLTDGRTVAGSAALVQRF